MDDYHTLARKMIEKSEKDVLTGYLDQGKIPTWGRGHTGPEVRVGQTITQEHSDLDFTRDLALHDHAMLEHVDPAAFAKLTEHQKAALFDFAFNTGGGPLGKGRWKIWRDVDTGNLADIPTQLDRFIYVHVDGVAKTSAGLKNRRNAERVMWDTGDVGAAAAAANAGGNTVCSAACRVLPTPPAPDAPKALAKTSLGLKIGALVTSGSGVLAKLFTPDGQERVQNVHNTVVANAASFGHFGPAIASVCGAAVVVVAAGMLVVHVSQQEAAKV